MVWVNFDGFFIGFETGSRVTKLASGKSFLKPLFSRFFWFHVCCHIVLQSLTIKNNKIKLFKYGSVSGYRLGVMLPYYDPCDKRDCLLTNILII